MKLMKGKVLMTEAFNANTIYFAGQSFSLISMLPWIMDTGATNHM